MASNQPDQPDPLLTLRRAIASDKAPILTTTDSPTSVADAESNIAVATHIQFNLDDNHITFPLSTETRFVTDDGKAVDLRSIYFAWLQKDKLISEYISATQQVNEELASPNGAGGSVTNLVFGQRIDLIGWLEGQVAQSQYIKPLAEEAAAAAGAADIAAGAAGGIAPASSVGVGANAGKQADPRLIAIYEGERKMGDRNSVLRGIKPTDFSHIRKIASSFLASHRHPNRAAPNTAHPAHSSALTPNPLVSSLQKKPSSHRRAEPIILLSPSASSLLRMSNIKSFLQSGVYVPPDAAGAGTSSSTANILHISRALPSVDPHRPLRFILVDTPDQFKPDYWSRVVAVFTTGQTWQFKSYKWTQPAELFSHALGVYVGWRGEETPAVVRGWGRNVVNVQLDKWNPGQTEGQRWRDREVVETIWSKIEESMRAKGWGKDR